MFLYRSTIRRIGHNSKTIQKHSVTNIPSGCMTTCILTILMYMLTNISKILYFLVLQSFTICRRVTLIIAYLFESIQIEEAVTCLFITPTFSKTLRHLDSASILAGEIKTVEQAFDCVMMHFLNKCFIFL